MVASGGRAGMVNPVQRSPHIQLPKGEDWVIVTVPYGIPQDAEPLVAPTSAEPEEHAVGNAHAIADPAGTGNGAGSGGGNEVGGISTEAVTSAREFAPLSATPNTTGV